MKYFVVGAYARRNTYGHANKYCTIEEGKPEYFDPDQFVLCKQRDVDSSKCKVIDPKNSRINHIKGRCNNITVKTK